MTHTADQIIEAMARAICESDGLDWGSETNPISSGSGLDDGQQAFRDAARAAYAVCLRMLREPTRGMMDAWATAYPATAPFTDDECATADFHAMIDERIKELG